MADGKVVFETRLNNQQLERDYSNTVKKIQNLQDEMNVRRGHRNALAEQAAQLGVKLDEAKMKLAEMKANTAGLFSPEQIARQKETVAGLQDQWNGVMKQVEAEDRALASGEKKIEIQEERAARLTAEIQKASDAQKGFGKNTNGAAAGIDKLLKRVKNLAMRVFVFSVITRALRSVKDWFMKVAKQNDETADAMARLKGALLTMAQPLLTVIIPVFTAIVNVLAAVIGKIATFLSMLGGKTAKQSADAAKALYNQGEAYEDVADSAREASKQLMGFDELNTLQDNTAETSTDTEKASDEIVPNFEWADGVSETMSQVAKWVLIIAAGLALWKIGTMFTGPLATILTTVGKLAAGIGLVVVGIILLAAGFKDAFENGLNVKNMLTIIGGLLAAGLGISLLVGSWIPLIVAAIAGLLLALAQFTGNGGEMIAGFKQLFQGLSDFITGVFTGDWEKAWNGIVTAGKGAVNVLISIVNTLIDLIVAGLNLIQVNIPDWVPLIGGRHFGINIQNPPHIPYLAQGAVIPPNREFMAVLGDQKYGTNIEAPEDLIRKIVREETAGMGGSARLEQLLEVLIDTVEGIEVGDETIGKAAARYSRATARARGT